MQRYYSHSFNIYLFIYFLATLHGLWVLISRTGIEPGPLCSENAESQSLDCQGNPYIFFFPCMISLIIVLVSLCSTWSGGNLILVKLCGPCYPFLLKFSSKFLPSGEFGRIPNLLHHLGIWYLAYQTWAVHCWVVLHAYPQDTSIAHCSFCSSHATLEHVDWRVWEVGSLGSAQGWARCKVSFLLVYFLAASHGMWDLSFQIRDWTRTLCIGSAKSLPLDHQGSPTTS